MMRPFSENDFPVVARGYNVYRRTDRGPICTCADQDMATAIALRLNRDNCVYPEADAHDQSASHAPRQQQNR